MTKDSWLLAKLCGAAYQKENSSNEDYIKLLKLESRALGFSDFETFNVDEIEGFVVANETHYIEIFRGTDEPLDWIRNALFNQVPSPLAGLIHFGFYQALDEVWPKLELLRTKFKQGRKHLITGHSLGGAIATLAFARCAYEGVNAHELFTFGSPKVGNLEFAGAFDKLLKNRSYRFVNQLDMVPSVPLHFLSIKSWVTKYSHTGTYIFLSGKTCLFAEEPNFIVQWVKLASSFFRSTYFCIRDREWPPWSLHMLCKARLDNHSMYSYISSINASLPRND